MNTWKNLESLSIPGWPYRSGLKLHIDDNASDSNKKINDLAVKLSKMLKDTDLNMRDLTTKLSSETSNLKSLISKPLSVYFNAYRTEDYVDGGEDYLTFQGKRPDIKFYPKSSSQILYADNAFT